MRTAWVAAVALTMIGCTGTSSMAQDVESGQALFRQCRAYHQIGPGAKNLVGPQLNGIIGRKASSSEGFSYSDASKAAAAKGLTWTEEELMKYLEAPAEFMPGTKMAFAGLKDEADRKDLIAYLKSVK